MPPTLHEKIRLARRRQRFLVQEVLMFQRVMEGIRDGMKLEHLLKLIIQSVCKGMGFKRCGIFLVEPDGKHIKLALGVDGRGRFERDTDRYPITARRGENDHSDIVNGYKKFFLTNNVPGRFKEKLDDGSTVFNLAVVPIQVAEARAIGTLAVDNLDVHRPISRFDVATLLNYATQLGLAIDSLKNHELVVSQSLTDPLTGLNNRRFFEKALDLEIKRCQRYNRAFSLVLADIDYFKKVNDQWGHDAGDEVLKYVGLLLRDNLRSLDMVARIGGEEFAMLLPETPPNNVSFVTRRLLREIRGSVPPLPGKALAKNRVTVSLGIASFRGGTASAHQMFKLADKSLYHAKNHGRDRCGPLQVLSK